MDAELLALCKQTVSRYAYSSSNRYNDYTWSATVSSTFLARIEHKNVLVRDALGQEVLSTCQIYCDGGTVIDPKDKITADDFYVDYPEIAAIDSNPDENGDIDHKVIYTK